MTVERPHRAPRRAGGFTLVELAVVVVAIGVLAAFGVPRFVRSVEQARAAEAFEYLASIRIAQERHRARYDAYAPAVAELDVKASPPRYFTMPATFSAGATSTLRDSWALTLTRAGASAGYGAYTVAFTEAGFDPAASTIARGPAAVAINPIGD